LSPASADADPLTCAAEGEKDLIQALMLFRKAGDVEMTHDGEADLFTIRVRHQP
jgi:hypothetical protein